MSEWEQRYVRAVANYAKVPEDVPVDDIKIDVYGEDGYKYSSWTFADPSIRIAVSWPAGYAYIEGPESVAGLIKSFLAPPS